MGSGYGYPELGERRDEVSKVLRAEEVAFDRNLALGEREFEAVAARSTAMISGGDAFRLHDTFGFPIEMTVELGGERGLSVDREAFEAALAEQRQRSRRGARKLATPRTGLAPTEFLGYDTLAASARVVRLFAGDAQTTEVGEGHEVEVYLDRTPFYAESGGQVGDIGILESPGGTVEVRDVQRQGEANAHYGTVVSGEIRVGDEVAAEVDHETRWATMRHHSATHLLHAALRQVLGQSATQAGSYVAPDTCTFDFTLERGVGDEELDAVFSIVAHAVRDDVVRTTRVMPLNEARRSGAMQLFGEKYGDQVRVVSFGDFSLELCGGTHVDRSGQIGSVAPVTEKSIGAGLRRIEFLAGEAADRYNRVLRDAARRAAAELNVSPGELPQRIEQVLEEQKRLRRRRARGRRRARASCSSPAGSRSSTCSRGTWRCCGRPPTRSWTRTWRPAL